MRIISSVFQLIKNQIIEPYFISVSKISERIFPHPDSRILLYIRDLRAVIDAQIGIHTALASTDNGYIETRILRESDHFNKLVIIIF